MSNKIFFAKTIIFVVVIGISFYCISLIFDHIIRNNNSDKINWIINKKDSNYDFVFIGSSDSYRGLDFNAVSSQNDLNCINISQVGTAYDELHLVLKLFLNNNNVKHLVIAVSEIALDTSWFSYPFHEYKFMPYLNDTIVFQYLKKMCGKIVYIWKYVPMYKYAAFSQNIGVKSVFKSFLMKNVEFDKWGSAIINDKFDGTEWERLQKKKIFIHGKRTRHLVDILDYAKEIKLPVTIIRLPRYYRINEKLINLENVNNYYMSIANKYGFNYISLLNDTICYNSDYFSNYGHLNNVGANVFTRKLFKELTQLNFKEK